MIQEAINTAVAIVPSLQSLLGNGSAVPLAAAILAIYIWTIFRK
jgi:hypothetical protein